MASDLILEATDQNFAAVTGSRKPVVVDFWASWCAPCRQIAPLLEQLADEFEGSVRVAKVNVDENPEVAKAFGIRSIPTLVVVQRGQEKDRHTGAAPLPKLRELFARATR